MHDVQAMLRCLLNEWLNYGKQKEVKSVDEQISVRKLYLTGSNFRQRARTALVLCCIVCYSFWVSSTALCFTWTCSVSNSSRVSWTRATLISVIESRSVFICNEFIWKFISSLNQLKGQFFVTFAHVYSALGVRQGISFMIRYTTITGRRCTDFVTLIVPMIWPSAFLQFTWCVFRR